jgi:hypothetical protein
VDSLLNRSWDQYNLFHGEDGSSNFDEGIKSSTPIFSNVGDEDLEDQDVKFSKVFSQHQEENDLEDKSEVDRYLSDRCEAATQDFNILLWWKINAPKYPILAEVARDVLIIHISTVASESAFSNGGRILNSFRSSLSPFTVEALICTQDWLKSCPNNIEEMQKFMGMESYDEHGN